MITFTRCYVTTTGTPCVSLKDAQVQELVAVLSTCPLNEGHLAYAKFILEHKAEVMDILTTSDKSRPKARALNGGRKARRIVSMPAVTPAAVAEPSNGK